VWFNCKAVLFFNSVELSKIPNFLAYLPSARVLGPAPTPTQQSNISPEKIEESDWQEACKLI